MIKFIGNTKNIFDWNKIIAELEDQLPSYVGPSHKREDNILGLDEILDIWDELPIKYQSEGGELGWDMFIPGENFSEKVIDDFAEFIGLKSYNGGWISRLNPGMIVPLHWDVQDNEEELEEKQFKRYHCHISPPEWGHVFFIEGKPFYNQEQGNVYEWSSRKLWHAGNNVGWKPKYLLNFW